MPYIFNITTTDSKIISNTLDLDSSMTIKDLKLQMIGPMIERIGYEKLKFFQTGRQFNDDEHISDFEESERILIFPLIPSLRTILINNLNKDETSQTKEIIIKPLDDSDTKSVASEKSDKSSVEISVEEKDDEEVELTLKSQEEIDKQNIETLKLFRNETMVKLLNIYKNDRDNFLEFINYISFGSFTEFTGESEYEYASGILTSIRNTFPDYKDLSDEELKSKLDKYGGNLDLMLISEF